MVKIPHQDDDLVTQINAALSELPRRTSLNWKKIAELSGLPTANVFYNLNKGRSKALALETYIKLSRALNIPIDELLGFRKISSECITKNSLIIRSKACAGVYQDSPDLPFDQQYQIALPIAAEHRAAGAYGVEYVRSDDRNNSRLRTVLVVLPFRLMRDKLCAGQEIVLHCRQGLKVEIIPATIIPTLEGLAVQATVGNSELAEPQVYPIKRDGSIDSGRTRINTIEAIVIAKWQTSEAQR